MPLFAVCRLRLSACAALTLVSLLHCSSAAAWTITAPEGVELRALTANRPGGAIAVGSRLSSGRRSVYVSSYAADGALLWESGETLGGDVFAVATTSSGDVVVAGTHSGDQDRSAILAARFRGSDGRLLWQHTVSPLTAGAEVLEGAAAALSVGSHDELFLGGYVRTGDSTAAVVARLDPTNGNPVWIWTTAQTTVTDLAVDRRGCVLVTGTFLLAAKLRGTDGAQVWRVNSPSASLQARGYPQMRSLALDSKGNVTVGGSLRNTLEETRTFLVTRLAGSNGRRLAETAGAARYSFESPVRLVSAGSDTYVAGRLDGAPSVLRVRAARGAPRWVQQPWELDDAPDRTMGVADLDGGADGVFAVGTDFPGRLLVRSYNSSGKPRWTRDFGDGRGVRVRLVGRRLYILGSQPGVEGIRSVLLALDPRTGASLD